MPEQSKSKWSHLPLSTSGPIDCAVSGSVLLNTPYFNHGSAHSQQERRDFDLTGLLPTGVQTLEQQVKRAYQQYSSRQDDLAKNTFLTSLKEQNLVLYYRVRHVDGTIRHIIGDFMLTLLRSYYKTT
jgi:malate dehydrogenase (oxaloacetate-decarboxylating)